MTPSALFTPELADLTCATAEAIDVRDSMRRLAARYPEAFGPLREEAERLAAMCVRRLAEETARAETYLPRHLRLVD